MTQLTEEKLYYCAEWICKVHNAIYHSYRPFELGPDPFPMQGEAYRCYQCGDFPKCRLVQEYVTDEDANRVPHSYTRERI